MTKSLTFAQKIIFTTANIKLLSVLLSGPKTFLELRTEGIASVDNTLYFLDVIKKSKDGTFELTESGTKVASTLTAFLEAVNNILPGG